MTREDKKKKRILRAQRRGAKNKERNEERFRKMRQKADGGWGLDCPYAVEMYGSYGTCDCNHENYNSCWGDI